MMKNCSLTAMSNSRIEDMATGPTIPRDPIELLTPDLSRPEPYINKYFGGGIGAIVLWVTVLSTNYVLKRPVFSGLQQHAMAIVFGGTIGQTLDNWRNDYLAERDAVLRHYITLHPEDFPPTVAAKFGDVLLPWYPIR